jgi:hypothetical protein
MLGVLTILISFLQVLALLVWSGTWHGDSSIQPVLITTEKGSLEETGVSKTNILLYSQIRLVE